MNSQHYLLCVVVAILEGLEATHWSKVLFGKCDQLVVITTALVVLQCSRISIFDSWKALSKPRLIIRGWSTHADGLGIAQ